MTNTHSTSRALGLTVLLLLSVVGGSVAFVGAAAAEEHGDAMLVQDSITEHRGDVVYLDVELNGTDTGYVWMSYEGEYGVLAEVVDGNDDGMVSIEVNTYYARVNDVTAGVDLTDASKDAGDELTVLNVETPSDASATPLPTGTYDVAVGTELDGDALAEEQDTAEVTLEAGSLNGMRIWTAPYDPLSFDTREQFLEQVGLETLGEYVTETEYVAEGDYVVVQVDVSGVYGQVEYRHDLIGIDEFGEESGISLTIEEVNPSSTSDEVRRVDLTSRYNALVVDETNDTMYLLVNTHTDTFEPNTVYEARFEMNEHNMLVADSDEDEMEVESVSKTFAITERRAVIQTDGTLAKGSAATLRGTTSAAPMSLLTVELNASDGDDFPMSQDVRVGSDQTFSATYDLSGVPAGTNVTASVIWNEEVIGETSMMVSVVEDEQEPTATAEPTPTPTPEPTPAPTTTAEPTTAEPGAGESGDGGSGGGETSTTTPGFGLVAAVAALAGAALLAARSRR